MRIQAMSTAEIRDKAHMPGWDLRMKISVLSIALSPAGWLLLAGGGLVFIDGLRRRDWRAFAWVIAALPAIYPVLNILSPKYLLPAVPFLLLLFVRAQELAMAWFAARWQALSRAGLIAVTILPWLASLSLVGHAPFLLPGLSPVRPVGTHDGARGYGGYVWQMIRTDAAPLEAGNRPGAQALARDLASGATPRLLLLGGENLFEPGGMGWRHLQLILERQGIHGVLVAPHVLNFDLGRGRRLILARDMPAMATSGYRIIDLRRPTDER
ncbi:hypothetical protein [Sphingobium nicotianae]|uniref:Uncharacterized protein n=1 Tax=Sphingobium nicotianae TaxID=2782607 RepID=A0A9X1DDI2_9SPHN|nr:hypothetical protein [Sphingobium nicotianae]MBT2187927.1 hypothetical protein [Sphingobium nicotianae]